MLKFFKIAIDSFFDAIIFTIFFVSTPLVMLLSAILMHKCSNWCEESKKNIYVKIQIEDNETHDIKEYSIIEIKNK